MRRVWRRAQKKEDKGYRMNEKIQAREVFLIDENNVLGCKESENNSVYKPFTRSLNMDPEPKVFYTCEHLKVEPLKLSDYIEGNFNLKTNECSSGFVLEDAKKYSCAKQSNEKNNSSPLPGKGKQKRKLK